MNYRDWLQQVIYKIINPVVHGMIKIGITPNFITTTRAGAEYRGGCLVCVCRSV